MNFANPHPTAYSDPNMNIQAEFDNFYSISNALLDEFYPERTVSMTTQHSMTRLQVRRESRLKEYVGGSTAADWQTGN
jgi:hypothetical protein